MGFVKASVALVLLVLSSQALADFEKQDWKTAGDNNVTIDNSTGLSWLNLSATAEKTMAQVKGELSTTYAGWRLANESEVAQLLSNIWGFDMGYITEIEARSGAYLIGAREFNSLMGKYSEEYKWTLGYVYDSDNSGVLRVTGSYVDAPSYSWTLGVNTSVTTTEDKVYTFTNANYSYVRGVYLVRDTAGGVELEPEQPPASNVDAPSAFAALSMVGLLGWRNRRYKAH